MTEKELIEQYQKTKSKEALEKLIEMHKGFICKIARKYYSIYLRTGNSNYLDFDDFYHTVIEGFIKAICNFELSYNNKLLTYAKNWMEVYAKLFLDKNICSLGEIETKPNEDSESFDYKDSSEEDSIERVENKIDFTLTVQAILKHLDTYEQFVFMAYLGLLDSIKRGKDISNIAFRRHQKMAKTKRNIIAKIKKIEGLDKDIVEYIINRLQVKRIRSAK